MSEPCKTIFYELYCTTIKRKMVNKKQNVDAKCMLFPIPFLICILEKCSSRNNLISSLNEAIFDPFRRNIHFAK